MDIAFDDSFLFSLLDISVDDSYFFYVPARLVCDSQADDFLVKETNVE